MEYRAREASVTEAHGASNEHESRDPGNLTRRFSRANRQQGWFMLSIEFHLRSELHSSHP